MANGNQFTILFDDVVADLGLIPAAVYGVIWRYCQRRDKQCYASQQTLADHLGISRQTLNTHLSTLVAKGYITDTTPDRDGRTHTYRITDKRNGAVTVTDEPVKEPDRSEPPVKEDDNTCQGDLQPPVKDFDTRNTSQEYKKDTKRRDGVPSQGAPGGAPKRPLSDKQRERNALRKQLTAHFEKKTGLVCPTKGSAKGIGSLWWNPVREMLELSEWDIAAATRLMDDALARLEGLTVADPNSLLKTCRAIRAEERRRGALRTRAPDGVYILPVGGYSSRGGRNGR